MKNLIFSLGAIMLLFSSCSGDESGGSASFDSNILVNGNSFTPGANNGSNQYVMTSYDAGINNGEANVRIFHLQTSSMNIATVESVQVSIIYPSTQASIDGTYPLSMDAVDFTVNNMAQGMYSLGMSSYFFETGTITVSDLGNDKFKLTFNNAGGAMSGGAVEKTVTGYGEGKFIDGDL